MAEPWWDYDLLRHYGSLLSSMDPSKEPELRLVWPDSIPTPRRLALFAGSFNPLTMAHLHLARAALDSGRCDAVWLLMAVVTVDKERVTGTRLEDRLACLQAATSELEHGRLGVALCNRGLYVDQAEAAAQLIPQPDSVTMVVGFDKIEQVFDPRYYSDRETALDRLFARASFLVAARGSSARAELASLMERPANAPYAKGVAPLEGAQSGVFTTASSSAVRNAIARGDRLDADVPRQVADFLEQTGAYQTGNTGPEGAHDRYALRWALIDALIALRLLGDPSHVIDLRRLYCRLLSSDHDAASIRRVLLSSAPIEAGQTLESWRHGDLFT